MSRLIGTSPLPSPMTITTGSRLALGSSLLGAATSWATGTSPWSGAANVILACPLTLEAQTTFYKGFWVMGSAGGTVNREVGLWDDAFNKIVTTGAVAGNNTNSVPQTAAFTATVTLPPGSYYMGMAYAATTTNTHLRANANRAGFLQALGCWQQAGVTLGSLAATATPADITNAVWPLFGVITRSVFDV